VGCPSAPTAGVRDFTHSLAICFSSTPAATGRVPVRGARAVAGFGCKWVGAERPRWECVFSLFTFLMVVCRLSALPIRPHTRPPTFWTYSRNRATSWRRRALSHPSWPHRCDPTGRPRAVSLSLICVPLLLPGLRNVLYLYWCSLMGQTQVGGRVKRDPRTLRPSPP
jgi:hypothetical protein